MPSSQGRNFSNTLSLKTKPEKNSQTWWCVSNLSTGREESGSPGACRPPQTSRDNKLQFQRDGETLPQNIRLRDGKMAQLL